MLKKHFFTFAVALGLFLTPALTHAHFGMLIANQPYVSSAGSNELNLDLRFWHPRANTGMDMEKPVSFAVLVDEQRRDLTSSLVAVEQGGYTTWQAKYTVDVPGDHIFFFTPPAYYEPTEDIFIIHHTKIIIDAYGLQDNWDASAGLPVEIIPLTRPYGLYPGNSFSGRVLLNGTRPLPDCEIEFEFFDDAGSKPIAHDFLETQVVKTDKDGYFTISFPWGGWWGMSAWFIPGLRT